MAGGGSHLKRLKASLRDQGITGPQKSKKQKREARGEQSDKRLKRHEALKQIREQFNPFDLNHAKAPKFEVTTNRPKTGSAAKGIIGRPTASNSAAEEQRRQTILADYQNRSKVGGIIDKRFGELDQEMTEEARAMERFAAEKQRRHKKSNLFDLEEPDALTEPLTHMGQALTFEEGGDDFNEDDLGSDSDNEARRKILKRLRAAEEDGESDPEPERKKTKNEIYEEIIAKSKQGKYERQVAKDEDEEMRMELDKELPDLRMLLAGHKGKPAVDAAKPVRLVAGVEQSAFNKDFDRRLKQLVLDKRSKPTDRTKTEEEQAEDAAKKLRELEEKRQKRMRGETVSSDESSDEESEKEEEPHPAFQFIEEEAEDFGLGQGIKADKSKSKRRPTATELGFEDEDDFEIDDDLVASGSDMEPLSSDDEDEDSEEGGSDEEAEEDYEDDEFTKDLLNEEEIKSAVFSKRPAATAASGSEAVDASDLPYSFPCPTTLDELRELVDAHPLEQLPKIIQRIRALYHPKLDSKHKEKMEAFSVALVDFIAEDHAAYGRLEAKTRAEFFTALEQVIRHLHSLAKSQPIIIAKACRARLQEIAAERTLAMHAGDILLLHAIGVVFSVSDHFHPVVTPALLTAARQLGNKPQKTLQDHARGIYLSTLAVSWSQLSKRYVPEAMNSILQALTALSPAPPATWPGNFPVHESTVRISNGSKTQLRKLRFSDVAAQDLSAAEETELAVALIGTACSLLEAASTTWAKASSFHETFEPAVQILKHLTSKPVRAQLPAALVERAQRTQKQLTHALHVARISRRTVELHHHRPLAIKSGVPRFEDTFDPTKHYDPDRERAEMAKLRAEHKRERKSAMREIRKDARFMAREQLKTKVARDDAHKKKMDRLVAEIQNEEGREANAYEREREGRKKARAR
ncbi:Nop14-like family protein [Plectosphaerella plurivora]|uniref:Nop14-like family protein n=1 Tax=Plectosphaerella plurivora TaxID=936078 RepID=A0A9P9ADR7_9PEZI|nr:Nop14-like family protein [Plectosphaerella plurivora]